MEPKEKEQGAVTLFVKVGIVVLSIIMIIGFGIKVLPGAITVSNTGSKRDLPIYCVNTDEPKVALSFDAAWGNEDTRNILDILAKHNVKVTFFMTGGWVDKYPEDVKAIAEAGHDLGNHSENHKQMSLLSKDQCTDEIMKVHDKILNLTGIETNLFRPPYGDYNNTLVEAAREAGYYTIQWDVDVYATALKQGLTICAKDHFYNNWITINYPVRIIFSQGIILSKQSLSRPQTP